MTLLGLTCLMAGSFVEIGNLLALSVLLFALNLLAATQDISVDSLAVHALKPEELGAGSKTFNITERENNQIKLIHKSKYHSKLYDIDTF